MSSSYDAAMIDTALIEDERLLKLDRGIRHFHIEALVWSKLHRTDGRIPAGAIQRFTDEPDPLKAAAALAGVGLWVMTDSGWMIQGFTDTQMSAERVRRLQDAAASRYDKWRSGHPEHPKGKHSNGVGNGVANGSTRPTALPTTREEAEGGGGVAAGLEPAAAALGKIDLPIHEIAGPTRQDMARMIREAPNPSLRKAYISAYRKTFGRFYPAGSWHASFHPAMATIVRDWSGVLS